MHVVITGASRGLGRAIAEKFAAEGHTLYLTSLNEVTLYHTLEVLTGKYPRASIRARPFDLSKKAEAIAFGQWVLEKMTSPAEPLILVNNAGIFVPGSVSEEADGVLENMLNINLLSAYYLTRTLLPFMISQKAGHIFNICSIASLQAYPSGGSYSITKYALAGFSKNLRQEMMPYGIKVTTVYPGAAYTDSWASSGVDPQRIMEAGDIAYMVFAAARLSPQACVEEIVLRPQAGDLP